MRKEPPFLAAVLYWFACALFLSGVGIILYQCIHWLRFGDWPHIPLYVVFGMPPLLELRVVKAVCLRGCRAPADRRIVHTLVAPVLNLPVAALVMVLSAIPYALGFVAGSVSRGTQRRCCKNGVDRGKARHAGQARPVSQTEPSLQRLALGLQLGGAVGRSCPTPPFDGADEHRQHGRHHHKVSTADSARPPTTTDPSPR